MVLRTSNRVTHLSVFVDEKERLVSYQRVDEEKRKWVDLLENKQS